jgi:hypothetical protein
MPNELKPMKAWIVKERDECACEVVFADTRGKARALARHTDTLSETDFTDIEVRREPNADKYYKDGKWCMDWENPEDRIALVKDCGFSCDPDYFDLEYCADCVAKDYCDMYKDHIADLQEDNP